MCWYLAQKQIRQSVLWRIVFSRALSPVPPAADLVVKLLREECGEQR